MCRPICRSWPRREPPSATRSRASGRATATRCLKTACVRLCASRASSSITRTSSNGWWRSSAAANRMLRDLFDLYRSLTDPPRLSHLLHTLLAGWAGYAALFAVVYSETGLLVGFFLPGDSFLFTIGVVAGFGALDFRQVNLLLMVAALARLSGSGQTKAGGWGSARKQACKGLPKEKPAVSGGLPRVEGIASALFGRAVTDLPGLPHCLDPFLKCEQRGGLAGLESATGSDRE